MAKANKPRSTRARTQAKKSAIAMFQCGQISGLGTARAYADGLAVLGNWMAQNGGGGLQQFSFKRARQYLAYRATVVGQKTLDRDRQAIQHLLRLQGKLKENEVLRGTEKLSPVGASGASERSRVIKSAIPQELSTRAYTAEQFDVIKSRLSEQAALAAEVAYESGLRAQELLTLGRRSEQAADQRPADAAKFIGMDNHTIYTVVGKGGLVREVSIPNQLVERIEKLRLTEPEVRRDRGIVYETRYRLTAGQTLSQSFSTVSRTSLGYSTGIHGLRHAYAQRRVNQLQRLLGDPERARLIVSQELGHFRMEILEHYLR